MENILLEDVAKLAFVSAPTLGPDGSLLGKHRKMHLFDIDVKGGQSFREWEALTLQNGSVNLIVTPQDAEGDTIISAEIEKYVAGSQTMEQAIANMDANLKAKIGTAEVVK